MKSFLRNRYPSACKLFTIRGVVLPGLVACGFFCEALNAADADTGIAGMAPVQIVRHRAPDASSDKIWLYQVAMPFQVSSTLAVWLLNAARTGLEDPIVVRDCRADFGSAAGGANWTWRADHSSGMTVRLADEKWHHLLGVRVQDIREITAALPPTPHTGMHVHELLSRGMPHPSWRF